MTSNEIKLQERIDALNLEAANAPAEYSYPVDLEVARLAKKFLNEDEQATPNCNEREIFKGAQIRAGLLENRKTMTSETNRMVRWILQTAIM